MKNNGLNTEKAILEAAEAEFLERGYEGAKMLSIARRAGVAHSMLHYYYRSKENLFQAVFRRNMQVMMSLIGESLPPGLSFVEVLGRIREARDNYLLGSGFRMPYFLLTEILSKPGQRDLLLQLFDGEQFPLLQRLKAMLAAEVEKGAVRPVRFTDFIYLLLSFDASSLTAIALCQEAGALGSEAIGRLLSSYREHNMQLLLEALRP